MITNPGLPDCPHDHMEKIPQGDWRFAAAVYHCPSCGFREESWPEFDDD